MREIELTQGWVAWVDDEDFGALSAHKWCADVKQAGDRAAAVRNSPRPARRLIYMHNVILAAPPGFEVDHRQHHPDTRAVDNRRANLRFVARQQNNANARKAAGKSSRYKGVSWFKPARLWRSYIRVSGESRSLGYYRNEEDAARAYDQAAVAAWGEHALTNFATSGAGGSLYGGAALCA